MMSRVPVGKVLLRNVIRHTDAHNKIQEESEMWKLRDMELQTSSASASSHRWTTSSPWTRSNMHCDRYFEDSEEGSARDRLGERDCLSERDEREARYWTRKLYEFEASDPDRWGHSGFKELYPEEFESDRETNCKRSRTNGKEKMSTNRRKSSRKSSKRKKKKKRRRCAGSGSASDASVADSLRRKRKRKSGKSKHSHRKRERGSRAKEEDSSESDRSESDTGAEVTHSKRRRTAADTRTEPERKRRKNWKAANEEKSEEDSEED